ncbi:EcsC family protein, partial [Escherichia coli]|nr:EcsC family protein [Escherichia coli]
ALSGAIGGAFGFSALAIELPVSTTIMLRSIADIARSEGFDLDRIDTKLECLAVFSYGGPSEDDDAVNTANYATRNLTAEIVQDLSKEISNITVKNAASTQTGKWLASLIEKVATRYGIVITEKMAAQAASVLGALAGATLNTMFTDYYQDMARGHFIVKRLERKYGDELIKAEYIKISDKLTNQNQRKHLNSN